MFVQKSLGTHAYVYSIILHIKKNELPNFEICTLKNNKKTFEPLHENIITSHKLFKNDFLLVTQKQINFQAN